MKFNKKLESIKTYEAGKPIELVVREFGIDPKDIIKLASNENPYGCSPKVIKSVSKIVANMALYPDDSMTKLKNGLQSRFEVEENNIIIGSGSDQVIEFIMHAKANANSKILMNSVTFAMYEIYAKHIGAVVIRTTSQKHDLNEFYELYKTEKPDIIFLCTPNNPTGDAIDRDEMMAFIQKINKDTLVVIDGAYMEYTIYKNKAKSVTPKELIKKYDNVIYLGTFSKAYGLGGMRVGYGIADSKIIKEDTIVDVKFSGISWYKNEGFYYSSYDKPKGSELSAKTDQHKLYYHKLGTSQKNDVVIFGEKASEKHRYVSGYLTEDHTYLIISASTSTSGNKLFIKDLSHANTIDRLI